MYLGIDFGTKRIGLALGTVIPRGAGVLDGTKAIGDLVADIKSICIDNDVERIIIGMPKKPSGTPGELAKQIESFGEKIESELKIPVFYEEEELTSVRAEEILRDTGQTYDKASGKKDQLAAVLILEQYINQIESAKKEK